MTKTLTLEEAVLRIVKKHGGVRATEAAIGVDKAFISRLMNGKKVSPSADTLAKLGLEAIPRYKELK